MQAPRPTGPQREGLPPIPLGGGAGARLQQDCDPMLTHPIGGGEPVGRHTKIPVLSAYQLESSFEHSEHKRVGSWMFQKPWFERLIITTGAISISSSFWEVGSVSEPMGRGESPFRSSSSNQCSQTDVHSGSRSSSFFSGIIRKRL